jgi:hypothetical protein
VKKRFSEEQIIGFLRPPSTPRSWLARGIRSAPDSKPAHYSGQGTSEATRWTIASLQSQPAVAWLRSGTAEPTTYARLAEDGQNQHPVALVE